MRGERKATALAGMFVLVCGLITVGAVIVLARRSQIFTERYVLQAKFTNVQGLREGASVRLAGVEVGSVKAIHLGLPVAPRSVVVHMEVDRRYKSKIRGDSVASIRTLGALGDKYVEISMGDPAASPPLPEGAFVQHEEPIDFYAVAEELRSSLNRLGDIASSVHEILARFRETQALDNLERASDSLQKLIQGIEKGPSALHTLALDPEFATVLDDLKASAESMRKMFAQTAEEGGAAKLFLGEDYEATATWLRQSAESLHAVLTRLQEGPGLLHTLIYEQEDLHTVDEFHAIASKLNDILRKLEQGEGTLGLLLNDPTVWEDLRRILGRAERSRTLKYLVRKSIEEEKPEVESE